jgi:hypothetical protein
MEEGEGIGVGVVFVGFNPVEGGVEAAPRSSSTPGAGGGGMRPGASVGAGMAAEAGVGVGVGADDREPESQPANASKIAVPRINLIDRKIFLIFWNRAPRRAWPRLLT